MESGRSLSLLQSIRLKLIVFLAVGCLLGAGAGMTANRTLQLVLVGAAVAVGIYAGFSVFKARGKTLKPR